jgi:hypothetical protein
VNNKLILKFKIVKKLKNSLKNKCKKILSNKILQLFLYFRANLKFAYQDMNKQRDVEEAKLKQSNPKKAEQMERLGMGFGNRR